METATTLITPSSNELTSSAPGSLASLSATQVEGRARETTAGSGLKCFEQSGLCDHPSSWVRTFTASLLTSRDFYSKVSTLTWKQRATKQPRRLYFRLLPSVPHIEGIGSGFVPTPTANEFRTTDRDKLLARRERLKAQKKNGNGFGLSLGNWITITTGALPALMPTPTAVTGTGGIAMCKWGGAGSRKMLRRFFSEQEINGALNPLWVEWLMGFPPYWTATEPSEMP